MVKVMECSEACLVHRVGAYPLVAASINNALQGYTKTKEYSPLLKTTLGLCESSAAFALSSAAPLYSALGGAKVVGAVESLAVSKLDAVEAALPGLKMEPQELIRTYYDGSLVQRGLGLAWSGKDASVAKAKLIGEAGKGKATDAARYGLLAINAALDRTDRLVDTYIAVPETSAASTDDHDYDAQASLGSRLTTIAAKAGNGLWSQAATALAASRQLSEAQLGQLSNVASLVDYVRGLGGRLSASVDLGRLRDAAFRAAAELESRAKALKVKPEELLLAWIKGTSGIAAALAHKTSDFVPTATASIKSIDDYLRNLDEQLKETDSLSEAGSEMWKEVKTGKDAVEGKVVQALESLSDSPPLSWMTAPSTPMSPPSPDATPLSARSATPTLRGSDDEHTPSPEH